jgi:hypothetical protein
MLTVGHQRVAQDTEPRQHQRANLEGAAAQAAEQQQGAHLGWEVHHCDEDLEQEDIAA